MNLSMNVFLVSIFFRTSPSFMWSVQSFLSNNLQNQNSVVQSLFIICEEIAQKILLYRSIDITQEFIILFCVSNEMFMSVAFLGFWKASFSVLMCLRISVSLFPISAVKLPRLSNFCSCLILISLIHHLLLTTIYFDYLIVSPFFSLSLVCFLKEFLQFSFWFSYCAIYVSYGAKILDADTFWQIQLC